MNHQQLKLQQQNLYNHLPCGCMSVDVNGLIINANDTFFDYVGYEREETINQLKIDDFMTSESLGHINKHIKPLLNLYGYTDESNLSIITKEGHPISCSIQSILEKDDDAKPKFYHHTIIDISDKEAYKKTMLTQMRRAENAEYKLKKLTNEIQNINSCIHQEIYNPLRNILGLIALLKKSHSNTFTNNGRQFLDFVGESGEKIRQHLNELLQFSTKGSGILEKEQVDLNQVIDDVRVRLNDIICKYEVSIFIPDKLPSIFGLSKDLNLLFYNLLKNAIQFKKATSPPLVIIQYEEDDDFYHFTIEDNGMGIEKKYHSKIFEEYFHLDPESDDCAGLGLSESRAIVENHKGTIGVISNSGKGCTIYFSLEK
jgi:PAS domain S-box-containing protein